MHARGVHGVVVHVVQVYGEDGAMPEQEAAVALQLDPEGTQTA